MMADVFSPNRGRGQPPPTRVRWSITLLAVLALACASCSDGPLDVIGGTWAIDADPWLADPSLETMRSDDRHSLDPLARDMARSTRFTFTDDRCVQTVMGRERSWRCRPMRVDRGTAVLEAIDDAGTLTFVRGSPREGGLWLEWSGRRIPLRRVGSVDGK